MSTALHLVQGTPEWHDHRNQYRNASETPAVMGLSPWVSTYQLWELRTGRRIQEVNFAMKRGSALEPKAREAYEAKTGLVMEPLVMVDGEYSASLDGISLSGDLILEVKCPAKGRLSETWRAVEAGSVPEHYYWQVQHQLMVTKADKAHFYAFDDDSSTGIWVEVLPNVEDMDRLQVAWNRFMLHIANDEPPPLSNLDTVVRQDVEWQQAALAYVSAKSLADRAIEAVESTKANLVALSQHSSEKGFGVSVSKYWKASSGRQEVRISLLKSEQQPC